jgi:hypothetical protein
LAYFFLGPFLQLIFVFHILWCYLDLMCQVMDFVG